MCLLSFYLFLLVKLGALPHGIQFGFISCCAATKKNCWLLLFKQIDHAHHQFLVGQDNGTHSGGDLSSLLYRHHQLNTAFMKTCIYKVLQSPRPRVVAVIAFPLQQDNIFAGQQNVLTNKVRRRHHDRGRYALPKNVHLSRCLLAKCSWTSKQQWQWWSSS